MDDDRFLTHRGIDRFELDELDEADRKRVAEICAFEKLQMSGMNGEPHKRVRLAAQKGFGSPRALDMADYVKRPVGEIAARMAEAGGAAVSIQTAYSVPLLVVVRIPRETVEDMDLIHRW